MALENFNQSLNNHGKHLVAPDVLYVIHKYVYKKNKTSWDWSGSGNFQPIIEQDSVGLGVALENFNQSLNKTSWDCMGVVLENFN